MKKFLICFILLAALTATPALAGELTMRGCWVSSVYNLDYPSAPGLSVEALTAEADAIVAQAKAWGMNTLFLQVRPCSDALYPSKIYPWSAWLSGTQGTAPDGNFDPLAYFLDLCHHNGISLHAWINPYRVTRTPVGTEAEALAQLCDSNPARDMTDCLLFSGGCLYLDPGQPRSQQLILDGVRELLENYNLDGIHLDDYFYPSDLFDDSDTVAAFGSAYAAADDFRRASVDTLVAGLQTLTHEIRPKAQFGVSPFGIWANKTQIAGGSDTVGSSSYFNSFADSRKWVREGLVDYILPQLYWCIGNQEGEFQTLLDWWGDTVRGTGVKLCIGLAAYRIPDAAEGDVWYGSAEIERELNALEASETAAGAVLFRFGSVCSTEALSKAVGARFCAQRDKYKFLRDTITIGLSPTAPTEASYVASGSILNVTCAAAPGSRVNAFSDGGRTLLTARADGSYSGALIPPPPTENETSRTSALLCTAERNGFLWVKLFSFTITSVACKDPVTLTDVSGSDQTNGHLLLFDTGTPCAVTTNLSGDALRVTISPIKAAILFEDPFFRDIRMTCENNVCVYTLALPESGAAYTCSIEWETTRIGVWIRRSD
ncbi:MAG: family 10 glycosylhydrolase [Clostridiaceae bacterium]|nr:family 10 glycosylhydrolase [Clostridiaceae bacterium]